MDDEPTAETCSRCGGELPRGRDLDKYLVRDDADCPGYLRRDRAGQVLGCGAWSAEAWDEREKEEGNDQEA